jgi:hypothetical protein
MSEAPAQMAPDGFLSQYFINCIVWYVPFICFKVPSVVFLKEVNSSPSQYLLQSDLFEALEANITEPHSHTLHCLDYLRESIICASDSTLEPFKPSFDTAAPRKGVDGYGTPHQCRDFGKLRNWAERFRYNDNQGFETYEG